MSKTTTVTLVNISDVYDHLELTNQEVEWIADRAWSSVQCWVHRDTVVNEGQVEMKMREAWEHEHSKDEMNIDLRASNDIIGMERKRDAWGATTFQEKPGQGTDPCTRERWEQELSAFKDRRALL